MNRLSLLFVMAAMFMLWGCGPRPGGSPELTPAPANPEQQTPQVESLGEGPGIWSTTDETGVPFDLLLFPNGQAVSTWVKGPMGAMGERGYWRKIDGEIFVFFEDGWTDRLCLREGQFVHEGFAPTSKLDLPPSNSAPATFQPFENALFTGVWRLNREPDGSFLYFTLQANGAAFSTVNGFTEGQWQMDGEAARATWPDGWVDVLERVDGEWQKRSWVGGESETPADLSPALRVGEKMFEVVP